MSLIGDFITFLPIATPSSFFILENIQENLIVPLTMNMFVVSYISAKDYLHRQINKKNIW